jgi:membrane-anchored mycosin MYCP
VRFLLRCCLVSFGKTRTQVSGPGVSGRCHGEVELRLQASNDALRRAGISDEAKIATEAEIVVALKHAGLVRKELEKFTRRPNLRLDDDTDLGLGRIAFKSEAQLRDAAITFREFDPEAREMPVNEQGADVLDSLLRGLRGKFKRDNSGWAPLMGKNRVVGVGVGNKGKVGGGGGGALMVSTGLRSRPGNATSDAGVGVRVGVLDTQIYANPWYAGAWTSRVADELKPALAKRRLEGCNLPPAAGHATFVTGIVLQQAPAATVIARSVLDLHGEAPSWEVAKAIVALARTRPQVMNLSFLCFTEDGDPPLALSAAIDKVDTDTVIVAAAGNHGDPRNKQSGFNPPAWPAGFDRVVAVASADNKGKPSSFSPRGQWIDVYIPGEDVRSTFIEGRLDLRDAPDDENAVYKGFATWSGSSFAAAKLSGAVAARTRVGSNSPSAALAELLEAAPKLRAPDRARTLRAPPLERYFDHPRSGVTASLMRRLGIAGGPTRG